MFQHAMCSLRCLTLCKPMDCLPPASPVQGIFQAKILKWVAISYSRRSSRTWIETASLASPALAGGFLPLCHLGRPHISIENK